jgi:hypothetical protein
MPVAIHRKDHFRARNAAPRWIDEFLFTEIRSTVLSEFQDMENPPERLLKLPRSHAIGARARTASSTSVHAAIAQPVSIQRVEPFGVPSR